jgi:hypothetical protein
MDESAKIAIQTERQPTRGDFEDRPSISFWRRACPRIVKEYFFQIQAKCNWHRNRREATPSLLHSFILAWLHARIFDFFYFVIAASTCSIWKVNIAS